MWITIYIIGAVITLIIYASGQGQKFYEDMLYRNPMGNKTIIKTSVVISIMFYVLLWFIVMPYFLIKNSFYK